MNGRIESKIVFYNTYEKLVDEIKCLYYGTTKKNETERKSPITKIKELYKNGISIEKNENSNMRRSQMAKFLHVKVCIVSDEKVEEKYMEKIKRELNKTDCSIFSFILKSGDSSKNIENAIKLYQKLIKYNFSRNDLIIGLGGGVVGDFSGFVASTYKRGTKLAFLPTTVLSQADSCIGGKTAVNFYQEKNMIGTFYPADLVYINSDTIKSLSQRQYCNGFAEIIKEGYILDVKLLQYLYENYNNLMNRDDSSILEVISWCNRLKFDVVQKDPYDERGYRENLNFGHTMAHAIEAMSNYEILHGEAVAIGMLYALQIGYKQGTISSIEFQEGYDLIQNYQLLKYCSPFFETDSSFDEILFHMKNDKKNSQQGIGFVLLNKIGSASKKYISDRFFLEETWEELKLILKNDRNLLKEDYQI